MVFRSGFPAEGAMIKLRNVTRVTAPGKLESEEYMAMKDAPETLFAHVEARSVERRRTLSTRRPSSTQMED